MAEIEDSEDKFRRNLLVFCALVIVGVYLEIPLSKVLEQVLGIPLTDALPERLLVVQCAVFAYLVHRYYFANPDEGAVSKITTEINALALSKRYSFVAKEVEKSNSLGGPTGSMYSLTHSDVVSHLNTNRQLEDMGPISHFELITKLEPPNQVSTWLYDMTPVLYYKDSDRQFAHMKGLRVSYQFTTTRKIYFYTSGTLKTLFAGSALTEHLVPLFAVIGTACTLAYRFYQTAI